MKRCKVWKLKQAETKYVWKDLKDCFLEEAVDVCGEI